MVYVTALLRTAGMEIGFPVDVLNAKITGRIAVMRSPVIRRFHTHQAGRCRERGVTMILVALAMVSIIAIAALSIDVVTLYLAREEAQRSADAAAMAAARVLSLSGVRSNRDNIQGSLPVQPWQAACTLATQVAQAVVKQNTVGRSVVGSPTVSFLYNGTVTSDCTAGGGFGVGVAGFGSYGRNVSPKTSEQVLISWFSISGWSRTPPNC